MKGRIEVSEEEVKQAIAEWFARKAELNGMRIASINHASSYSLSAEIEVTDEPEEVVV